MWTEQIYVFTTMEADGKGSDPVKLAQTPSNLLSDRPNTVLYCGTLSILQCFTYIFFLLLTIM